MESINLFFTDENKLFFILSVVITLLIFIIERILIFREKKTSNLSFIENKCITLFSPLIEDIDQLKITYQNSPIKENLIFYQATIFNSGVSDIPNSSIYKPLCLKLQSEYKWRSFKMYDKSEGLLLKTSFENNNLNIEWDLFKKEEYFRFDAVIEYTGSILTNPKEENTKKNESKIVHSLSNKISFGESRIVNLQVSKQNIRAYESLLRWSKTFLYFLIIFLSLNSLTNRKSDHIVFTLNLDTIPNPIEFSLDKNKQVILVDSLSNEYQYNSINKLLSISKIVAVRKEDVKPKELWTNIMFIICPVMLLLLFEQRRMRKKREKMNLISPGPWNPFKEEDC